MVLNRVAVVLEEFPKVLEGFLWVLENVPGVFEEFLQVFDRLQESWRRCQRMEEFTVVLVLNWQMSL